MVAVSFLCFIDPSANLSFALPYLIFAAPSNVYVIEKNSCRALKISENIFYRSKQFPPKNLQKLCSLLIA